MTDSSPHTWECPHCNRRVPVHVHKCRCGLELDEADKAVLADEIRQRSAPATPDSTSLLGSLGRVVVGYKPIVNLAWGWRLLCGVIFLASGAAVFAVTGSMLEHGEAPQGRRNIRVLGRLDDYTRLMGPKLRNSIPGFLAMSGRVGVIDASSPPRILKDIPEGDLQRGFCSASVVRLIRQQYPGSYDTWNDADLERTVLVKHPEYKTRLCILPAWIDAAPHDIVKYDPAPAAPTASTARYRTLLLTTLATAAFAIVLMNVYYRVIA